MQVEEKGADASRRQDPVHGATGVNASRESAQAITIRPATIFERGVLFSDTPGFIAELGGKPIGSCGYRMYDDCVYAYSMKVEPGSPVHLFARLTQKIRRLAKDAGLPVRFQVDPNNLDLLHLLKGHARLINVVIELK